jgi:HlyD family secretion protein
LTEAQRDLERQQIDVGKIRTGQKATFTVDAFAGQTFEGEVRQVRKAVQNAMIDMTANLAGMTKVGMKAGIAESLEHVS